MKSFLKDIIYRESMEDRSRMLRKNIILSAVCKMAGLAVSLLIVPATLGYLDIEVYGVWLTLTSVLYWFTFFDVGLGNGMRNYLTKSISEGNLAQGRAYLSTALVVISGIAVGMAVILSIPVSVLDFSRLFNTRVVSGENLRLVVVVAMFFALANLVVKNIGYVFIAYQRYAVSDFLALAGNLIALLLIVLLTYTTEGNLLYVVMAFTATPVLIYTLAAIPVFAKYPQLRPSLKAFDISLTRQIVGKGLGFFIIQITSCLVIFGSSNLFIARYAGPSEVTVYNIAYKFFHLIAIAYTIIISPMWNAYTDAYVKSDYAWIKKTFSKAVRFWVLSVAGGGLMLLLAPWFYRVWVGGSIEVPFVVSLTTFAYISMFNLNNCVTYLLNGLNKIRVQIITSVVFTALYLLLVGCFGKYDGIIGVTVSMAFCYGAMALIHAYQCGLLINNKAKGIWNS